MLTRFVLDNCSRSIAWIVCGLAEPVTGVQIPAGALVKWVNALNFEDV